MADTTNTAAAATTPKHPLPQPFNSYGEPFELIAQGAESLLYHTTFLSQPAALKVRPEKKWRHPTLDKRLTRARILAEARVLVKLSGEGIASGTSKKVKDPKKGSESGGVGVGGMKGLVPAVLGLDWERAWLVTEWVEGGTVKEGTYSHSKMQAHVGTEGEGGQGGEMEGLLRKMGEVVGKLHGCGVVHGDLTTSNMMLRPRIASTTAASDDSTHGSDSHQLLPPDTQDAPHDADRGAARGLDADIVLIDFGLATQSVSDEDRAVDLYVLERAFGSTHPREEHLFPHVLEAYAKGEGSGMKGKPGEVVLRRLEDVRMRGRKKSMVG